MLFRSDVVAVVTHTYFDVVEHERRRFVIYTSIYTSVRILGRILLDLGVDVERKSGLTLSRTECCTPLRIRTNEYLSIATLIR